MDAPLETPRSRRISVPLVLALALLAVAARLPGAIRDAFWQDEVSSARVIVQPSLGAMLHQVRATEATPPLWYALGWLLHELGFSPYGYRFFSVLCGGLLAVAMFLLARRLLAPFPAAVSTAFIAFGYQFVYHGRELRAYELYALLAVLFAIVLLRAVERPSGQRLLALGSVVAAGSLTNYFFLVILACGLFWVLLSRAALQTRLRTSAATVAGLVLFAPWIPSAIAQYDHHHFAWIGPFKAPKVLSAYWLLVARVDPHTAVLHDLAPSLTLAAVLVAAVVLFRRPGTGRLVAVLAVLPVAITAAVWAVGPEVFDPRNVLGTGPFAAIAIVAGLARMPVRLAAALGGVVLGLLAFGYASSEATPPTDYEGIAHALVREGWNLNAPVILYGGNFFSFRSPLEWYLPGRPALTVGLPTGIPCQRAYAVAVGDRRGEELARRLHWRNAKAVTRVMTATLPAPVRVPSHRLRAVHVLTVRRGHATCVRPLTEVQLHRALG